MDVFSCPWHGAALPGFQQHRGVSIFEGQVGFVVAPGTIQKRIYKGKGSAPHSFEPLSSSSPHLLILAPSLDGDLSPLGLKVNLQLCVLVRRVQDHSSVLAGAEPGAGRGSWSCWKIFFPS